MCGDIEEPSMSKDLTLKVDTKNKTKLKKRSKTIATPPSSSSDEDLINEEMMRKILLS
jgi:hypothetical protein